MRHQRLVLLTALVVLGVWAVGTGVHRIVIAQTPTAESFQNNLASLDIEHAKPEERQKIVRDTAHTLNRLDFTERQKLYPSRSLEKFFTKLSPEEQNTFVELTVATSMRRFMAALDAMSPEDRRKVVTDGLRDLREGRGASDIEYMQRNNQEAVDKITNEGLRAYFSEASAQTKLDLAPLMEELDKVLKGFDQRGLRHR